MSGQVASGGAATQPARVCVVGGAGFVGSILAELLLDQGYEVTILDALLYGDEGIRHLLDRPGLSLVTGDLRDITVTIQAFRHASAVVHLGALVGDPACAIDEQLTLEVNRDATAKAAAIARGLGIDRFIFASTCSVYGASAGVLDEDSPLEPISVYARSKVESEQLLLAQSGPGFWPTVLRFGTLYGQSQRERFDLVVNLLTAQAVATGEITVFGGTPVAPVRACPGRGRRHPRLPRGAVRQGRRLRVQPGRRRGELHPGPDRRDHQRGRPRCAGPRASPRPRRKLTITSPSPGSVRPPALFPGARWPTASRRSPRRSRCGEVPDYTDSRYNNYKALMSGEAMTALAAGSGPLAASPAAAASG